MTDASFQDGDEQALSLVAATPEDLAVISSLIQDAVTRVDRVRYQPRLRRFSLMLYRFRWEDRAAARAEKRPYERVAAALSVDDVKSVRTAAIDQSDRETVLNLLDATFDPAEDGAGALILRCSGGATFNLAVECLNVSLTDLTRPWKAEAAPSHE